LPVGIPVEEAALRRVEAAEDRVRAAGFVEFRVRHHGDLARLEVPFRELHRVAGTELGRRLAAELTSLGYRFVTFDLLGFRSGSSST
jgi:uncharacterized protein